MAGRRTLEKRKCTRSILEVCLPNGITFLKLLLLVTREQRKMHFEHALAEIGIKIEPKDKAKQYPIFFDHREVSLTDLYMSTVGKSHLTDLGRKHSASPC